MAFDPDEYLATPASPIQSETMGGAAPFDPDAYLAETAQVEEPPMPAEPDPTIRQPLPTFEEPGVSVQKSWYVPGAPLISFRNAIPP